MSDPSKLATLDAISTTPAKSIAHSVYSVLVAIALGAMGYFLADLGLHRNPIGFGLLVLILATGAAALLTAYRTWRGGILNVTANTLGTVLAGLVIIIILKLGEGMSR